MLKSKFEVRDFLKVFFLVQTQLRERNDRLFQRLEQIQEKLTDMAKSKSELSTKLVTSEEEKLKVRACLLIAKLIFKLIQRFQASKGLVELQLENNRLTEEYEAENFDLKNKVEFFNFLAHCYGFHATSCKMVASL